MKSYLKTYSSSLILILSIIVGGVFGYYYKDQVQILKPIGDLFLNILFISLIPLIFFCITSSFTNFNHASRINKILKNSIIVFVFTGIISSLLGLFAIYIYNPTNNLKIENFQNILSHNPSNIVNNPEIYSFKNLLSKTTQIFTTNDFFLLLSKNHILPLIVFSFLFGLSIVRCKNDTSSISKFLNDGKNVMLEFVNIVMKFAPLGLGVYFANVVSETGPSILAGYFKIFILYLILTCITYFIVFTFYAYIAGGKKAINYYWKNILPPTVMSLASCSSAASLPTNLLATKKMNIPNDILDISLPLGVNIHKDGSIIGNIFKITFLFTILGEPFFDFSSIFVIILVSFISSVIIGAIPSGGFMGEMAILSMLAIPSEYLPLIIVISTIIDAPATLLNSTGNTVCSMMIARLTDGKDWINK